MVCTFCAKMWYMAKYYDRDCLRLYKMAISGKLGSPSCSISSILPRKYHFSPFYGQKPGWNYVFLPKIKLSQISNFALVRKVVLESSNVTLSEIFSQIHRKLNFLYENRRKLLFWPVNSEKKPILIFSDNHVQIILELLRRIR